MARRSHSFLVLGIIVATFAAIAIGAEEDSAEYPVYDDAVAIPEVKGKEDPKIFVEEEFEVEKPAPENKDVIVDDDVTYEFGDEYPKPDGGEAEGIVVDEAKKGSVGIDGKGFDEAPSVEDSEVVGKDEVKEGEKEPVEDIFVGEDVKGEVEFENVEEDIKEEPKKEVIDEDVKGEVEVEIVGEDVKPKPKKEVEDAEDDIEIEIVDEDVKPKPKKEVEDAKDDIEIEIVDFEDEKVIVCGPETVFFRTFDGTCNNQEFPALGSAEKPQPQIVTVSKCDVPVGKDRPGARYVSNGVCDQGEDRIPEPRGLSQVLTYIGQFIDHNFVLVENSEESFEIPVPKYDPVFVNDSLPFERSMKVEVDGVFKPLNSLSSYLDLSAVYGSSKERAAALRTFKDGLLIVDEKNLLPINNDGLQNAPAPDNRFFLAGDIRANEHPVLMSLHTIFVREHNTLAYAIKDAFADYDDELVYQTARAINIMHFQAVVYEEFLPSILGYELPKYEGYKKDVDPSVTSEFTTASYRLGHTLVENEVFRAGSGKAPLPSLTMEDTFFRSAEVLADREIEEFIRGAALFVAQEVDVKVTNLLRNVLFSNVPEDGGVDLAALNLQRGRDNCIPTYNELRVAVGLPEKKSIMEISADSEVNKRIYEVYGGDISKVDAWVGLLAEPNVEGGSLGETNFEIWVKTFTAIRDGDRFFYEQEDLLPPKVAKVADGVGGYKMREIILRNSEISPSELQEDIWFVPEF